MIQQGFVHVGLLSHETNITYEVIKGDYKTFQMVKLTMHLTEMDIHHKHSRNDRGAFCLLSLPGRKGRCLLTPVSPMHRGF